MTFSDEKLEFKTSKIELLTTLIFEEGKDKYDILTPLQS